ncbi:hypothetical protein LINPERHAP2_LOCUS27045, partial [Linum perenne]
LQDAELAHLSPVLSIRRESYILETIVEDARTQHIRAQRECQVVGFHHLFGGFWGGYYDVGEFAELNVHHVWTVFRSQVPESPVR